MPIKSTGTISLGDINIELGLAFDTTINLNQPSVRSLLTKISGIINLSDAYGRYIVSTNSSNINDVNQEINNNNNNLQLIPSVQIVQHVFLNF